MGADDGDGIGGAVRAALAAFSLAGGSGDGSGRCGPGLVWVFAAEKSSRVFGSHHAASDADVVALFCHPRSAYYSLRPLPTAVALQIPRTPTTPEVREHGSTATTLLSAAW
jgi:hypothetical protein